MCTALVKEEPSEQSSYIAHQIFTIGCIVTGSVNKQYLVPDYPLVAQIQRLILVA